MNYEWGPWIEHDGKGCPVKGQFVHSVSDKPGVCRDGVVRSEVFEVAEGGGSWFWVEGYVYIIRYRVRRPRVTEWLDEITSDVPEREDA